MSDDGKLLAYSLKPYFGSAGRQFASVEAAPPAAPNPLCVVPDQQDYSDPGSFSGDGSLFAYDDTAFDPDTFETSAGQGVWAFDVQLDAADCGVSEASLILPGASQPEWGPATP